MSGEKLLVAYLYIFMLQSYWLKGSYIVVIALPANDGMDKNCLPPMDPSSNCTKAKSLF